MRRLWLSGALITAVAVLAGGAGVPAASASPSAGYIDVEPSSPTSPPGNVGLLSVNIASDQPITSMTVDIVPVGGGTALLVLPMSYFQVPTDDGDGNYGTWTLTDPITTTLLPIGSYWVEVTAATADASASDGYGGTLNFLNEVSFPTFTSDGTTFNYDNQDVTFSGIATVLAPGGTPAPFAGEPLVITDNSGDTYPVPPTAADGSFSVTVPAKSEFYWAEYQGDPATAGGSSGPIQITVTQDPVTIKAALTAQHAKAGQHVQVTGTLTYSDSGVSKPLAGNTVTLYFVQPVEGPQTVATTVTDANGKFTMPVPTNLGSSITWYVQSAATAYVTSDTAALPMTVAEPTYIGHFRASLNAFAVVRVSGCIVNPSGTARAEYAAKVSGPWHVLGKWRPVVGTSCRYRGQYGSEYSGSYYARIASAYYRVVDVPSYLSEGAVSSAVHLSRLLTKITSFRVSPRHFSGGGHFHASGRLWAQGKNGKWKPYGNRKVIVVFKYQGTWYRENREPKTNSAGWFSGRFPVYSSTPVFAQYNGDATHFASATKRVRITDSGSGAGARPGAAQRLAGAMRFPAAQIALLWVMR